MIKKLLALAVLLLPMGLMADTGDIPLSSNFQESSPRPLDAKIVAADATARNAIATILRYDGMLVYQRSDQHTWQLQGGTSTWVDVTVGGRAGVYPATATAIFPFGVSATTVTISSVSPNIPLYLNTFGAISARAVRLNTSDVTDVLPVTNGGTGQNIYTDGQILIGDSSTGGLDLATLTAGSNVTISTGSGSITIAASGGSGTFATPITVNQPSGGANTSEIDFSNLSGSEGSIQKLWYGDALPATFAQPIIIENTSSSDATEFTNAYVDYQFGMSVIASTNSKRAFTVSGSLTGPYNFVISTMGAVVVAGSSGTVGQVLTSGGANTTPSWTTLTGSGLSSTQVWTGANTFQSSTTLNGGLAFGRPNTITANYTAVSTDSVILVNNVANTSTITVTLPASSASMGQTLTISKVDTSTGPVKIQANGTDVIAGTGTLTLNAFMQSDSIISDGAGHWIGFGKGIQVTPAYVASPISTGGNTGTQGVTTSSDTTVCPMNIETPVSVLGFRYSCAATGSGTISFGIYDISGNILISTGPVTIPGTGVRELDLSVPVNLPAGAYYIGDTLNNTTTTLLGIAQGNASVLCSKRAGSTGAMASPYVFGATTTKLHGIFGIVAGGSKTE